MTLIVLGIILLILTIIQ
nr:Zgc:154138 protein [Danio rerio]